MSRNTKNVKKPYCKVCQDAGKPESEYTSHRVKDANGKTTCPTLLDTECRYCHGLGHTAKFCDVLAKNNSKVQRKPQTFSEKPAPVVQKKKPSNSFAALDCESDEEEDVQELPPVKKELTGWAAVAAKPKPEIAKEPGGLAPGMILLTKTKKITQPIAEPEPEPKPEKKPAPWAKFADQTKKSSWADLSDSDDDDEIAYNKDANDYAYNIGKYALPEQDDFEMEDGWD